MKRTVALLVVVLVLLGTFAASPAWARGSRHGHHHGWWWPGAIVGGLALGAVAAATYPLWAAPRTYVTPVYVPPVTYAAPSVAYAAPIVYQQPSAPLVQREVVYPHGRYVLYGDGVTQAWQWVWIPAAPPGPPPPPPR